MADRKTEGSRAFLYSAEKPEPGRFAQFEAFLKKKYGADVTMEWVEDHSMPDGFRLQYQDDVYNWTARSRLTQLQKQWRDVANRADKDTDIIPLLRDSLQTWTPEAVMEEVGTVLTVGDGIVTVSGIDSAEYGEILLFDGGIRGMVQELHRDYIGCMLFGDGAEIEEGSEVRRTCRTAGVPVGRELIGRVVNALGAPIDGKGPIAAEEYYPVESPAPGIIDRQPVNKPMETGLLAIDSMFPIGRGQRELIIGDRQTGKTAIAVDTILNQKGKNVICIYVAIGQKESSVAQLVENLRKRGAMDYTIVLCASAGEATPMQYIAPYAGCSMGEYFMNHGQDVLIVYDDLSKHAIAYREISLLLGRSPGREAYPGDVFYLHSRLLERSAHLSDEKGGGSMTALPIVETQGGDISAYIPTNIISITDGQLFLESDLFFSGQRPAVNVGLSVSRVGGDAQTKAMKKAAGTLRLALSQYREMEVFTQFASDLDETTKKQLVYGQGLMQMLRQPQYHPMSQFGQVVTLTAALNHVLQTVPISEIPGFIRGLTAYEAENRPAVKQDIERTGDLTDEDRGEILSAARDYLSQWQESRKSQEPSRAAGQAG